VCINFLETFLGYIKRKVEEEPEATHKFYRESPGVISHHSILPDKIPGTFVSEDAPLDILPSWYLEQIFTPVSVRQGCVMFSCI